MTGNLYIYIWREIYIVVPTMFIYLVGGSHSGDRYQYHIYSQGAYHFDAKNPHLPYILESSDSAQEITQDNMEWMYYKKRRIIFYGKTVC